MPTLTLPDFIAKWQDATLSERAAARSHIIDLCEALGQPRPADLDRRANDRAVRDGDRVLSAYETAAGRVWIITEWDRSATTLLLPEEY
jgi:hypothetical protein